MNHEITSNGQVSSPKSKQDKAATLDTTVPGKEEGSKRVIVRFIGYVCRPLDYDNFIAGTKDLLDGIVKAGLIPDDSTEFIIHEARQIKVATRKEERVEIEIILSE